MSRTWRTVLAFAIVGGLVVVSLAVVRSDLFRDASLERLSAMIRSWGIWAPVASVALMVLQALAAPIPSFLIAVANGVVFGAMGILVSYAGGVAGALAAFAIARLLGSLLAPLRRERSRLEARIREISSERGFGIVLVARLVPFVSFDLISYASGLSSISFARFLLATAIGMTPATVIYSLAGVGARSLEMSSRAVLLASLAVLAGSVAVWIVRRLLAGRSGSAGARVDPGPSTE